VNIDETDDTDAEINDGGLSAAANVAATSGGGTGGSASDGGHMPPTATSGGLPAPHGGHLVVIGASPSTEGFVGGPATTTSGAGGHSATGGTIGVNSLRKTVTRQPGLANCFVWFLQFLSSVGSRHAHG